MDATRLEQSYEDSLLELDSIRNALLQRAAQKQQALKAAKENGRQEPEKDDADNAVSRGACIQRQDTDRSLMEQHEEADEEQRRLSVELAGLNGVDYVEPQSDGDEDVDLPPPPPPLPPPPLITNPATNVHPSTPTYIATHAPPPAFSGTPTAVSASSTPQRSPEVCSAASASPTRHEDFADKLMRREEERRRRIDVLRHQREAQELSSLRSTPAINPISRQLAASASASLLSNAASSPRDEGTDECASEGGGGARVLGVAERSELYVAITRAKTEKIRQELQQKEVAAVSAAPVINESSRRLQRSVEDMMHWQQTVQAKKQARSAQCQEAATKELTHQPTLCTRSNQIYEQMKRQGKCGTQSVVDRLMAKGTEAKHKHEQARRKADKDARHQSVPEVAPHSATLPRHGPVEERLYAIAYENRVKQDERVVQAEVGRGSADGYRPKINRRSEALARHRRPGNVPVEEQLVAHGQYYEERRRRRLAAEQDKAKRMADARKITPRSEEIAEQLGSTAQERLSRPTGVIRSWTLEMIEEPSFKPRINKSRGWDNGDGEDGSSCGSSGGRDLLQRMEEWDRRRKERIEREREMRSRREEEECTFQPRVPTSSSRAALSLSGSCVSVGGADSTADLSTDYDDMSRASSARRRQKSMWERNAEWVMARDEKLERERQQKRDEELVGCSFAPRLATNRSLSSETALFGPPQPPTRISDPPTSTRQLLLNSPLSALVLRSPDDDDERSYYGDDGEPGVAQIQAGDREDSGSESGGGGREVGGAEVQYVNSVWRSLCEDPPREAPSPPVESAPQVRSSSSSVSVATTSSSSRRRPSLVFYSDSNPRPDPTPPPPPHHPTSRRSSISSTDAGAYNVASGQGVLPGGHWPAQVTAAWVAQQYMYEGQGAGVQLPARSENNELSEYIKKFQHLRMS